MIISGSRCLKKEKFLDTETLQIVSILVQLSDKRNNFKETARLKNVSKIKSDVVRER